MPTISLGCCSELEQALHWEQGAAHRLAMGDVGHLLAALQHGAVHRHGLPDEAAAAAEVEAALAVAVVDLARLLRVRIPQLVDLLAALVCDRARIRQLMSSVRRVLQILLLHFRLQESASSLWRGWQPAQQNMVRWARSGFAMRAPTALLRADQGRSFVHKPKHDVSSAR